MKEAVPTQFNALFPPPVGTVVDDLTFRESAVGVGKFYTIGCGEPGHDCDTQWCDLPTSSWSQFRQSLAWKRED